MTGTDPRPRPARYSAASRILHWLTVLLILVQIPLGFTMAWRGHVLDLWDHTTDFLYSAHKSLGFALLIVVVIRLLVRLAIVRPAAEPTVPRWQMRIAVANHVLLYLLLLIVPVLGWLGASLFPALEVFGIASLPSISGADRAASDRVIALHGLMAFVLIALVLLHVSAALHHHFVRRDGVLRLMLG